ncbi:hypothetical protein PV327_008403 [Microctonus hyperodae]|uniref:Uncharacterized protein n=1 Tax=Microctonus hyperodae TaxID=165561 RepID=A0AA39KHE7_MICHY|nr:hypothetical protein PV327_008403 [Microctonus hyperodae]
MGFISGGYCLLISSLALNSEFCRNPKNNMSFMNSAGSLEINDADKYKMSETMLTTSSPTQATNIFTFPMRNQVLEQSIEEGVTEVSDWRDKYMVKDRHHGRIRSNVILKRSMVYNSYDDEDNSNKKPEVFSLDDSSWKFINNSEISENILIDEQPTDGELFYI